MLYEFALHQKSPTYRVIGRTPLLARKMDFRQISCRQAARISQCWTWRRQNYRHWATTRRTGKITMCRRQAQAAIIGCLRRWGNG